MRTWRCLATTKTKVIEFDVKGRTFEEAYKEASRHLCVRYGGYQNIDRIRVVS